MHSSRIFSLLLVWFLLAVAVLTLQPVFWAHLWLGLLLTTILVAAFWRVSTLRFFLLITFLLVLAVLTVSVQTPLNNSGWWQYYTGESVDQNFIINSEPQVSGKTQAFLVRSVDQNIKGNISVSTMQIPLYRFGQVVHLKGKISKLSASSNVGYDKAQQIVAQLSFPEMSMAPDQTYPDHFSAVYFPMRQELIAVKNAYVSKIGQILPEPEAGLLSGIIFGTKAELSSFVVSILAITGTIHIIALSGYNITIVANGSKYVTKGLGRDWAFWAPTGGILLFVLATGLNSSVVRAAIMGVLLLLAARLGRQPDAINAVLFASGVMVLANPYILLYDVGFQLSFAAVAGIIFFAPLIERYFNFLGPVLGPILAGTFAAQIFSWPVIAYYFGLVSLVGLVANALVLPLIPFLMLAGFVTATLGFVSLWLARFVGIASWFMLSYILKVTEFLAGLKFAALPFQLQSPWFLVGYFLLILELTYWLSQRKRVRDAL